MKIIIHAVAVLLIVAWPYGDANAQNVTNGNNAGPGSLREALATDGFANIASRVRTITITETLQLPGRDRYSISGSGQTIDGSAMSDRSAPLIEITDGASVTIQNIVLDAGGQINGMPFSRLNQGGGKGILHRIPPNKGSMVRLKLKSVTIRGTGNHGIHMTDCFLGEVCGSRGAGIEEGSDALFLVLMVDVTVEDSGHGLPDADGIRIDKRGDGSVTLLLRESMLLRNGGDGFEIDMQGGELARVSVNRSVFDGNGGYCNLGPEPAPDDPCYDDGGRALGHGLNIGEAGSGAISGFVAGVDVISNFGKGINVDEADDGHVSLFFGDLYSQYNGEEGIKVSEAGDGSNNVVLENVQTDGDLKFMEMDAGILGVSIRDSVISGTVKLAADDLDPTTTDGSYRERDSFVGSYDFDGDIDIW